MGVKKRFPSFNSSMTYSEMQYRFLGNSGLKVSVLGYGGWLTCGNQIDIDQTATMLKAAYDRGVNFFDSAEQYSNGDSERAMGAAFKKFGWKRRYSHFSLLSFFLTFTTFTLFSFIIS
jgi:diketogulonate reductase-like aldo/keto reductase